MTDRGIMTGIDWAADKTKIEAERHSHLVAGQTKEEFDAISQDSELQAAQALMELQRKADKKRKQWIENSLSKLTFNLKHKLKYNKILTKIIRQCLEEEDVFPKYKVWFRVDRNGIAIGILNTKYYGAFQTCGMPAIDLKYAMLLSVRVGNTIAKLDGYQAKTDTGVYLPDDSDVRKYAKSIRPKAPKLPL